MLISKTEPSSLGLKLVTSNASTVILGFMTQKGKLFSSQVCRKWYYRFVPVLDYDLALNVSNKD